MIQRYRIPGPLGSNPVGGARVPGPLGIGPGIFAAPKQIAKAVKKLKMPAPGGDKATKNVHDVTWKLMEAPALGDVKQGRIYNCALASILGRWRRPRAAGSTSRASSPSTRGSSRRTWRTPASSLVRPMGTRSSRTATSR